METVLGRRQAPLNSRDLVLCQRVFDAVRSEFGWPKDSEEAERLAAIAIELYRQGVCNKDHLKLMIEAAQDTVQHQQPLGD